MSKLKQRLKSEGNETVTNRHTLKSELGSNTSQSKTEARRILIRCEEFGIKSFEGM